MAGKSKAPASAAQQAPADVDDSLFPSPEELNEAEANWNGGVEEGRKAKPVGTFQMTITDAELMRSGSGRLQIHYSVVIDTPGQFQGTELHKYDGLGSPQQANITQGQLQRLGIKTDGLNLKMLPAVLVDLKGKKVVAATKVNGEFFNINFQKLLTGDLKGSVGGGAQAAGRPGPTSTAAKGKGGKPF